MDNLKLRFLFKFEAGYWTNKSILLKRLCAPIVFIWLSISLTNCADDYIMGGPYWGTVNAMKNGGAWSGKIRGSEQNNLLGITIDKHSHEGFLREDLFVNRIPKEIGVYNIPKSDTLRVHDFVTSTYFTLEDDGDVILDVYYVDANNNENYVEVTSIDFGSGTFSGKFQISFVRDTTRIKRHLSIPDTIKFTNGFFKTRVLLKI